MIQIFAKDFSSFEDICKTYNIPKEKADFISILSPKEGNYNVAIKKSTSSRYFVENDWLED
jgi:hypothetical protein